MQPVFFPEDTQFWYETLRTLGHITYGGADFGEAVATTHRIKAGDYDSWHDEWLTTADRVAAQARSSLAGGHPVSARDAFLRASNYYRNAEFFLHGDPADPRVTHAYDLQVECFRAAAELAVTPIEPIEIPYEGTTLPGYFYRVDDSGAPRPTVLMCNGFDGSAEEMYFSGAAAAVERGYNVLVYDGPGQPGAVHRRGLHFRPDWENVVGPVIDYALTRPEVDPARLALFGNSMGGVLTPRAAAFEPRVSALITVDGIYDLGDISTANLPGERAEVERRLRADSDPEFDAMLDAAVQHSPMLRWAVDQGKFTFGIGTAREFCAAYLDYHVRDGIAERITCPTLVCDGVDDGFFQGQPELLYDHLTCRKTLVKFTEAEGADAHCQSGAQRLAYARVYDWLDDVFA